MEDRFGSIAGSGQFPVLLALAALEKAWHRHVAACKAQGRRHIPGHKSGQMGSV